MRTAADEEARASERGLRERTELETRRSAKEFLDSLILKHQPSAGPRGEAMKFDEIASRITGLSCPIFGVSWTPPEPERTVARRVVTFLEDRRVLYAPSEVEVPAHCVESVLHIRHDLTHELQALDRDTSLAATLRALRAACRKFLDTVGPMGHRYGVIGNGYSDWVFIAALGELRGTFGIHLATLATNYGLDVEDDLASILPAAADHDTRS